MNFKSEKKLKTYLNSLEFIGQGSQGICYLDKTNNTVIKIFHDFFEEGRDARYFCTASLYSVMFIIYSVY